MISERGRKEINRMIESHSLGQLITGTQIAKELDVSVKTVQSDIVDLNGILHKYGMGIVTVRGKGYELQAEDEAKIAELLRDMSEEEQDGSEVATEEERVQYIIGRLILSGKTVLSDYIANELYISRSRLSAHIKTVKEVLQKYNLKLSSKSHTGICIEGLESDKRRCLILEKVNCRQYVQNARVSAGTDQIGSILVDALSANQYRISDLALQNLVRYVELTLARIANGQILTQDCLESLDEGDAEDAQIKITDSVTDSIGRKTGILFSLPEKKYLAAYIRSTGIYDETDFAGEEMNLFILQILKKIRDSYGFDLTGSIQLRMNLTTHMMPMILRARNHMPMTNDMKETIRSNMALAYELATLAAYMTNQHFDVEINDDEISYLALHFYTALEEGHPQSSGMRVLLLTSHRNSESLMLRFNFLKYFSNYVQLLDVVQVSKLQDVDCGGYDLIFSTTKLSEEVRSKMGREVIMIDYFLPLQDRNRILAVMQENAGEGAAYAFFRKEYFLGTIIENTKEAVLQKMCMTVTKDAEEYEQLLLGVHRREEMRPTAFGNGVAIPHPDQVFSDITKVCIACLKRPVDWGGADVSLVFLIIMRTGGEQEMASIYATLSGMIADRSIVNDIVQQSDYEHFIEWMKKLS